MTKYKIIITTGCNCQPKIEKVGNFGASGAYGMFYDTWTEAKIELVKGQIRHINSLQESVEKAKKRLVEIRGLKKERDDTN